VVLASFLLGALDFALVKATTTPRRVEPFGLLEGLPGEAVAQAREWERHLVEVVTGLPPGAPQDAKPHPQYDVAVPLNERDRAKAEELTAAGQPVSERTVRRLRARYAEQGLVGLVDQRVMRPTSTVGRADERACRRRRVPTVETLWRDARVTTPPKGSPGQPASASQGRRRERLSFPYRTGEPLRDELARAGLAPSGGSSGGADTVTPSHVLEAVGIPITGSLRFWVHPGTSAADVERLLAVLPGIIERLRTDADAGAR
jgi:hypothetical protein